MDNYEKIISNVLSKEIYVPQTIEDTIKNSLNSNFQNYSFMKYKIIALISSIIVAISGVVYAGYYIYKNIFNDRKGIEIAIEHGYISNGTEEYIESNNTFIKINNSLMNDKNLDINFDILLKDKEIQDIKHIEFEKLLIVDEENNILYSNNINQLEEYIANNNLNITVGNFNDNYFNSGSSTKIRNNYDDSLEIIYNIASDSNYPTSKKINIYAENIILKNTDTQELITGKWNISEELPEIFQDRQAYRYHLVNQYEDIISAELVVYNTETTIDLTVRDTNDYSKEELNKKYIELSQEYDKAKEENNLNSVQELENKLQLLQSSLLNTINNVYIKNSNNEIFKISNSETIHSNIFRPKDDNYLKYSDILELTLYDATNNLQLHFTYNNKEYILEFIK